MSEYVPDPWTFALLALAAWRVFTLISSDVILEKPMDALLRRIPAERRDYWRKFIECPYCFGFYVWTVWWLAWLVWPDPVTIMAVLWAGSAVVALIETAKNALTE